MNRFIHSSIFDCAFYLVAFIAYFLLHHFCVYVYQICFCFSRCLFLLSSFQLFYLYLHVLNFPPSSYFYIHQFQSLRSVTIYFKFHSRKNQLFFEVHLIIIVQQNRFIFQFAPFQASRSFLFQFGIKLYHIFSRNYFASIDKKSEFF